MFCAKLPFVVRLLPLGFLSGGLFFLYHLSVEQLLKTLETIGISEQTIATIRRAGDCKESRAYARMLIAMYDDRHEYLD